MHLNKILSLALIGGAVCTLGAHDFWVNGKNDGDKFKAYIGYGHNFPEPEKISEKRVKLFEPLALVSKNTKTLLTQKGENYQFEGTKVDESAILVGQYKQTFWSKDKNGQWSMDTNKQNGKDIAFCGLYEMTAKSFVHQKDNENFTKPVGLNLEIVPVGDISKISVNQPFKFKLFSNGKVVKNAQIKGTFAGLGDDKFAFDANSDENGEVEFLALKAAVWMLKAKLNKPYKDTKICDDDEIITTLTFEVK